MISCRQLASPGVYLQYKCGERKSFLINYNIDLSEFENESRIIMLVENVSYSAGGYGSHHFESAMPESLILTIRNDSIFIKELKRGGASRPYVPIKSGQLLCSKNDSIGTVHSVELDLVLDTTKLPKVILFDKFVIENDEIRKYTILYPLSGSLISGNRIKSFYLSSKNKIEKIDFYSDVKGCEYYIKSPLSKITN